MFVVLDVERRNERGFEVVGFDGLESVTRTREIVTPVWTTEIEDVAKEMARRIKGRYVQVPHITDKPRHQKHFEVTVWLNEAIYAPGHYQIGKVEVVCHEYPHGDASDKELVVADGTVVSARAPSRARAVRMLDKKLREFGIEDFLDPDMTSVYPPERAFLADSLESRAERQRDIKERLLKWQPDRTIIRLPGGVTP